MGMLHESILLYSLAVKFVIADANKTSGSQNSAKVFNLCFVNEKHSY